MIDHLESGAQTLGIALNNTALAQLQHYMELMAKWNRVYNLTAIHQDEDVVSRHILDSLSIIPYVRESLLIDVGTGPGLPGIPLAISCTDKVVHLLDSSSKKTRFLQQVKAELKLDNVVVLHARVEQLEPVDKYEAVLCRALASLGKIQLLVGHLLEPGGKIYAMKGKLSEQELREVEKPFNVDQNIPLLVPGSEASRHLIVLKSSHKN